MKVAISMPDALFKEAAAAAKELGISRGKLIRTSLGEFLERRRDDAITEAINRNIAKYGAELSEGDEAWLEHGQATVWRELADDDWGPERAMEQR